MIKPFLPALALSLALGACATSYTGPVEVTRFNAGPQAPLGQGTVAIVPAPGTGSDSLEFSLYARAVAAQLARVGYTVVPAGGSARQRAEIRYDRFDRTEPAGTGSSVGVGIGGGTGGYRSGVGLGGGISFPIGGGSRQRIGNQLGVILRDSASNQSVWEGRATFVASDDSPSAPTAVAAQRMADAMFRDFPGRSGETVEVK